MSAVKVKKASFEEALAFLLPALRELNRLNVPYTIHDKKLKIVVKIPRFIPAPKEVENANV